MEASFAEFFALGIRSETMLHFLAQRGIYVSSGSAWCEGKAKPCVESGLTCWTANFLGNLGKVSSRKTLSGRGRPGGKACGGFWPCSGQSQEIATDPGPVPAGQPNFRAIRKPFRESIERDTGAPAEGADSVWLAWLVSIGKPLCCRV